MWNKETDVPGWVLPEVVSVLAANKADEKEEVEVDKWEAKLDEDAVVVPTV